ncbi:TetR/AcrR family transcriptional regulator [Acinetobacter sp. 187]|uniref:TetR/AcrR family transcriptional regulator n=1 Tax=Acinetobacter lanii TaxID=2715163 RepID=UPI00140A19A7|nr:TetR/AcrR family transcriptional regulator [Acinetobacter lanii]NHC02654.1 TetR/AcrR family transcriptional regulator [Acinetobacter lanii]
MLFEEIKLPVQKRSKARLELVIESTIKILEAEGLGKCTIPEIAKVANLPKINIYQYFPTVNHLLSILVKRYLDELQQYVSFKSEHYRQWETLSVTHDLINKVAQFYNANRAASVLILGGPVHVDGFNLQEMVIEKIAEDLKTLFAQQQPPLVFQRDEQICYLIEIVFALMKHSFYKFGSINPEVLKECLQLSDLYIHANTKKP